MPAGMEPAAPDDRPDLVWRDLRPVLDEEVHGLPAKYRMPIILCYFQGRTHAEAARELGCPKGTVSVRLQRRRDLLRGRLTRRGLALSAAALAVMATERTAAAAVPAAMVHTTLKAALLFAAGKAVAGAVSARAAAWTQGVLKTMFLSKLKVAAVVLLTAAAATGAGLLMSRSAAAPPKTDPPPVANRAEEAKTATTVPDEREKPVAKVTVEMSSELDGTLVLVGTDELGDSPKRDDLITLRVPFPALLIDPKDAKHPIDPKDLPPENQWLVLVKAKDSKFRRAVSQARAGKQWDEYKKDQKYQIYRRWQEGDPLEPGKVEMVFEQKEFRPLHKADLIKKGQLLAMVDPTVQVNDASSKVAKMVTAEAEFQEAIKTKEEAIRRASSAEFLYRKGQGYISEDDYRAAVLNRDRYIQEQEVKDSARQVASEELGASLSFLKACEIRSSDNGVVLAILKRKGESVHRLEPVVRLEVPDAAGTDLAPSLPLINVPSQRDGVLLVVGTDLKEGAKVPADQLVTIKDGGQTKTYRRLREGDVVEEGQLLARVDDRLARLDVDVARSKLDAARAELVTAVKSKEEADHRYQALTKLRAAAAVSEEELDVAKLNTERYAGEVEVKEAELRQVETGLRSAETVLEMYEIRSPVHGVVKAVLKSRGEAVKSLETVVQIQEKAKD